MIRIRPKPTGRIQEPMRPSVWRVMEPKVAARWQARRTSHSRWGPVVPAQRLAWRGRGL